MRLWIRRQKQKEQWHQLIQQLAIKREGRGMLCTSSSFHCCRLIECSLHFHHRSVYTSPLDDITCMREKSVQSLADGQCCYSCTLHRFLVVVAKLEKPKSTRNMTNQRAVIH